MVRARGNTWFERLLLLLVLLAAASVTACESKTPADETPVAPAAPEAAVAPAAPDTAAGPVVPVAPVEPEEAAKTPEDALIDRLVQGTAWYGAYFSGKKTGCMETGMEVKDRDGRKTFVAWSDANMKMAVMGKKSEMDLHTEAEFSCEAPYRALLKKETHETEGLKQEFVLEPSGDKYRLTTIINGRREEKLLDPTKENLLCFLEGAVLAMNGAQVGDKLTFWAFDMEKAEDKENVAEVTAIEERVISGVKVKVYTVVQTSEDMRITALYTGDGTALEYGVGPFTFRLEDEGIAKDYDFNFDALLDTIVRTRRIGKESGEVTELKVRISGLTPDTVLESSRQKYNKISDGVYELTLTMNKTPGPITGLGGKEAEFEKELKRTPFIQSDNEEIISQARKIVGDEKDLYKQAVLLSHWLYENLDKNLATNLTTALDVLEAGGGDCSEHTLLFVALARALGIPAREACGIMYAGDGISAFGYHAWPEVYVGEWVGIDPTWDEPLVDATHIKLCDADVESLILELMGSLKIEILEVK
jgi:hypothetical protein